MESQWGEVHADNVHKVKEQSIIISTFKTDVPTILGILGEGKESSTTLTEIWTPELWNTHDGVIGLYLRASTNPKNTRLKLKARINRELWIHMEVRLL